MDIDITFAAIPIETITVLHDNDVLCGRGGKANNHPGNIRFRELVRRQKPVYSTVRFKREKGIISDNIISTIKRLDPPGRFLRYDSKKDNWVEISITKMKRKTAQALREKQSACQHITHKKRSNSDIDLPISQMDSVIDKFSTTLGCSTPKCRGARKLDEAARSEDKSRSKGAVAQGSSRSAPGAMQSFPKTNLFGDCFGRSERCARDEESTWISSMPSVDTDFTDEGNCSICDTASVYDPKESYDIVQAIPGNAMNALMKRDIITPPDNEVQTSWPSAFEEWSVDEFQPLFTFEMDDDVLKDSSAQTMPLDNFTSL